MAPSERSGGRRGSKGASDTRGTTTQTNDASIDSTQANESDIDSTSFSSGTLRDTSSFGQSAGADRPGGYGVQGSGGNEAFGGQTTDQPSGGQGAEGETEGQTSGAGRVASGVKQFVRDTAYEQLGTQKQRATEGLGTIAQAVRQSTDQLRESQPKAAEYVDKAADQIEQFSSSLRDRDLEELLNDLNRFARRQPAVFIGTAFGIGLLVARFLKSSSQRGGRSRYGQSSWGNRRSLTGGSESNAWSADSGTDFASSGGSDEWSPARPSQDRPGSESGV